MSERVSESLPVHVDQRKKVIKTYEFFFYFSHRFLAFRDSASQFI